jgi:hypothetical protein
VHKFGDASKLLREFSTTSTFGVKELFRNEVIARFLGEVNETPVY